MIPIKSVNLRLLAAAMMGLPLCLAPAAVHAETYAVQQSGVVKGVVKYKSGEPAIGATVMVVSTKKIAIADTDGSFTLKGVTPGSVIRVSLIGCKRQDIKWTGGPLNVVLEDVDTNLNEVVVTAMGIQRKERSLTYATQQVKADDLMKVQDPNLVNSLDGKISGVTITQGAGGAGGASKILLRGNKSIQGNNDPLIVVDGIPMTNSMRGTVSADKMTYESAGEGADPLSMINPDDIESINVLKGANAAALYGSRAANGVVMITTKKGKEGRLDVNFTSNVTFDSPLLTPEIQNMYGALVGANSVATDGWGARMQGGPNYTVQVASPTELAMNGADRTVYLRDSGNDDVADFYRTGVTTNNSISLSGGTEKISTYFSFANSHANGMVENNSYNRNTFAFRQTYKLWDRVTIDVNANYVQTKTKNRVSGGTLYNPIYHLYMTPRNIDMGYYRNHYMTNGQWSPSNEFFYYSQAEEGGGYNLIKEYPVFSGPVQEWAYLSPLNNNPYWLQNMNGGTTREDRFYGSFQGKLDIYDGLSFQARVSIDHTKYNKESHRYATSWSATQMDGYGGYWNENDRANEIYTDYLLSYNKTFSDFSVSATAGWVGHLRKNSYINNNINSAWWGVNMGNNIYSSLPTQANYFAANAGGAGATSTGNGSSWDKAAIFTAQLGWKDMIYVDGSYRRDWYREFKWYSALGTPDNYGYFGFGANAILSSLFKMPEPVSYMKYRLSYSEVGNSIPSQANIVSLTTNGATGGVSGGQYNFYEPIPEKTKSFETGFETQFFNNALNFDITYYNSAMHNSYLTVAGLNGKTQQVNTGIIRNQGVEITLGYNWTINKDWRWKTSVNFSYNKNKIEETSYDARGNSTIMTTSVAEGKMQIRYIKGGQYGDMYATDYTRWRDNVYQTADGRLNSTGEGTLIHRAGDIYLNNQGQPSFDGNKKYVNNNGKVLTQSGAKFGYYLGNMNSKVQLSWSNTFSYKDFTLFFLINGRIGGKVVSLTEGYLDEEGLSQRTADARANAEANGIYWTAADGTQQLGMYVPDGSGQIAPIQGWYERVGSTSVIPYVYSATNFRLRELSFGYTFRNLLGEGKNLSLSFIGRNLFFLYKDAPVDPDISLSSGNGLGGIEVFNLPSARSFGFNLKLNF